MLDEADLDRSWDVIACGRASLGCADVRIGIGDRVGNSLHEMRGARRARPIAGPLILPPAEASATERTSGPSVAFLAGERLGGDLSRDSLCARKARTSRLRQLPHGMVG